jgi:hypothetical protein
MSPAFRRLCSLDRRLLDLYVEAATTLAGPDFCAIGAWSGHDGFKARMSRLVGFGREPKGCDEMETSNAYDIAYGEILAALPPCRGDCGCGEARVAG